MHMHTKLARERDALDDRDGDRLTARKSLTRLALRYKRPRWEA
jgi:hypothetical protein